MYKKDLNATIGWKFFFTFLAFSLLIPFKSPDETLQGISALSPNSKELPQADRLHNYVANQMGIFFRINIWIFLKLKSNHVTTDILEEKYRYYTLQDLQSSESSVGPRVSVKSFKVLTPRSSRSKKSIPSSESFQKVIQQRSVRGSEEVFVVSDDEFENDPQKLLQLINTPGKHKKSTMEYEIW